MSGRGSTSPWIKVEDYAERVLWVEVENPMSRTKATMEDGAEVLELLESGVILRIPDRIASEGHVLRLKMELRVVNPFTSKKKGPFKGTWRALVAIGRVSSIEKSSDGVYRVATVAFTQYDDDGWRDFLEQHNENLEVALKLVQARKG